MSEEPGKYIVSPQPKQDKTSRIRVNGKDVTDEIDAAISQRKSLSRAYDQYLDDLAEQAQRALATATTDPHLLAQLTQIGETLIECCDGSFEGFVREMASLIGNEIRPFLKGTYEQLRYMPGARFTEQMTPPGVVASIDVNAIKLS
ncbi:hypothetical protein [Alcanivorax sp.]|jgi:hypothetical protein|uniref:hypothetical protein n=1 Tax=Alcanivorax sp. TaxID=1872427 RepID=UPI0032D940A6